MFTILTSKRTITQPFPTKGIDRNLGLGGALRAVGVTLALLGNGFVSLAYSQTKPTTEQLSRQDKANYHSTLYKNYHTEGKLPELAAQASTGTVEVTASLGPPFRIGNPNAPYSGYPNQYLKEISSSSEAVLIGRVRGGLSHLTQDEDFIFTDYDFVVEEVIKHDPRGPIQSGATVTITRPGGTMKLHGRIVRAIDGRFAPFHAGGRYLLFLRFIPETQAYRALADRSFELVDEGPRRGANILAPRPPWINLESASDPASFLAEVRLAAREAGH
ncbi:MAG TPA: hypothetical protein VNN18_10680 [Candidatus Xenobia bacterium]|nr:hypothetical protein [Candidatus Xenobia bacterium]